MRHLSNLQIYEIWQKSFLNLCVESGRVQRWVETHAWPSKQMIGLPAIHHIGVPQEPSIKLKPRQAVITSVGSLLDNKI